MWSECQDLDFRTTAARSQAIRFAFGTRFSAEKQPRLAKKSAKLSLGGRGCIVNIDYDVLGHRTHNVRVRGDVWGSSVEFSVTVKPVLHL